MCLYTGLFKISSNGHVRSFSVLTFYYILGLHIKCLANANSIWEAEKCVS